MSLKLVLLLSCAAAVQGQACTQADFCPAGDARVSGDFTGTMTAYSRCCNPTGTTTDCVNYQATNGNDSGSNLGTGTYRTQATCEGAGGTWTAVTCSSMLTHIPPGVTCTTMYQSMLQMTPASTCCSGGAAADKKKDDPCFPSSALVTKADGMSSRVDALKEGDVIVAATADGALITDVVSLLSIAMPKATAGSYVALTTTSNATLTLTPEHHLPVGEACCSTLKKAKHVAVGETVWSVPASAAAAVPSKVVATAVVKGMSGLHSPVLANGNFPVVDGLVTAFDSIEKVTLAKHGLAPLLKACKATGTCDTFRELFLGDDRQYVAGA